jgi:hypothetical protein
LSKKFQAQQGRDCEDALASTDVVENQHDVECVMAV